jgi:ferredoxin
MKASCSTCAQLVLSGVNNPTWKIEDALMFPDTSIHAKSSTCRASLEDNINILIRSQLLLKWYLPFLQMAM